MDRSPSRQPLALLIALFAQIIAGCALAAASPAQIAQEYQQLLSDWTRIEASHEQLLLSPTADRDSQKKGLLDMKNLRKQYAAKFLRYGQTHPQSAHAVDALIQVFRVGLTETPADALEALHLLAGQYVTDPRAAAAAPYVKYAETADAEHLLRGIMEKNPDRTARGQAILALAMRLQRQSESRPSNPGFQSNFPQAEKLYTRIVEQYADIKDPFSGKPLGDDARQHLLELHTLTVGRAAPDIQSKDLQGNEFRLSDHRGKVVLLNFWSTECKPCVKMIPEERAMIQRLSGKPFVFIGISNDSDAEMLARFVKTHRVQWSVVLDSAPANADNVLGPIANAWNVRGWPTTYLVDSHGIIRYKNLGGGVSKDLESLVEKLLARTAPTK